MRGDNDAAALGFECAAIIAPTKNVPGMRQPAIEDLISFSRAPPRFNI